jgi:pectate lyase
MGCSGSETTQPGAGTGGAIASGGARTASGGIGTGGASSAGGAPLAPGGSAPTGATSSSGAPTTGGTSSGGASSTGGGTSNTGGASSTGGGTSNTGGASSTGGGTSNTGGASSTGGRTSTGGAPSTGNAGSGPPETAPRGYGQGTTGGGAKASQKASSLAEIQALIDGYSGSGGLVIEYTGKFDFKTISDPCTQHERDAQIVEIKRKGDITLLGADGSSANFGIHIASTSSNIIVRNMTIGLTPGADASDIISIEGMSDGAPSKVWIDHNEFFTSMVECDGAGDTEFDGMIDVKKGADSITLSYNHLHDHHKVSLNGSSDSDTAARHITFHHNLFENVGSRVPLQRGGYSHLVNNEFIGVTVSGINVRMGGNALVEANYFENVKNPVTSRDSDEIGFWDLRNNNLASASDVTAGNALGITWDDGDDGTVNATAWETTKAFPVALSYSFAADSHACVHAGLRAVVGAGKGLKTLKCD